MRDTDSTLAQFDQAGAQRLENIYLTPDVVQQREQIFQLLHIKPGMQALDIGCGPGLTSLALALAVGDQGRVDAIDIAPPMLQLAARRCEDAKQVAFHQADVLHMPFADGAFDVALATQVYEYVADLDAAFLELARVMKSGAQVLLVDTDWESCVWACRDEARMRRATRRANAFVRAYTNVSGPRILRTPKPKYNNVKIISIMKRKKNLQGVSALASLHAYESGERD